MRVSYLIRHRSGSLYFRYVFPLNLRPVLGREIRISLGLALRSEALPIAFQLSSKIPQLIDQVMKKKTSSISESQLRVWVRDMLKEEMREAYAEHCARRNPLSSSNIESNLYGVLGFEEDSCSSLVKGGYGPAEESARVLLREHGFDDDVVENNVPLCSRIVMQEHRGYAVFMRKLYSDPYLNESDIDNIYVDNGVSESVKNDIDSAKCKDENNLSMSVGDAIKKYIEYKIGIKAWNQKSSMTNPIILNRYASVLYNNSMIHEMSVRDVTLDVMSEYLSFMYGSNLSEKTKQNNFVVVKTFIKWCEEEGYVENAQKLNRRLILSAKDKKTIRKKKRTAFTNEDICKLFNSVDYLKNKHKCSWQFWVPLIGLFSGARMEEIAQLYVADIRQVGEVWCFDVNGEGVKSIKTASSKRMIPIHQVLLDLGLLERIYILKQNGHVELFPTLRRSDKTGKKGDVVSKWFTRYRRKCGVVDKDDAGLSKAFHSFRHTVVTLLRAQKVEEKLVKAVVGHELTEDVTDVYDANEISMSDLLENAIKLLAFDCLQINELKKCRVIHLP
jgi:integrase